MKQYKFTIPSKYGFYPVKNEERMKLKGVNIDYDIPNELNTINFVGFKKIKDNQVYYLIPHIDCSIEEIGFNFVNNHLQLPEIYLKYISQWSFFSTPHNYDMSDYLNDIPPTNSNVIFDQESMEKKFSMLFRDEKIQRLKEKL